MNDASRFDGVFRRAPGQGPRIYAHRGARAEAPENTLAAFDAAADAGAFAIELDVRVLASGEPVVLHDPTLSRTTDKRDARAISTLSRADLAGTDVGRGERVPLLAEVLRLARERGLAVNIELKHDAPSRGAIVRAAARVACAFEAAVPIVVSSFDPRMLAHLALVAPRLPRALLLSPERRYRPLAHLARPPFVRAAHPERTLTEPDRVAAWRARGLVVNVWTVNSGAEARDLARLGVDGLITDDPRSLRAELV